MSDLANKRIKEAIRLKSKSLNLGKCGLLTIPDQVLKMTWLEELILNNRVWNREQKDWIEEKDGTPNRITTLPKNLSLLKNLKSLRIGGDFKYGKNSINNIEVIENLTSLILLDFRASNIKDISFLKSLTNLTFLDIRSNKFHDISSLKNLIKLTTLYLSDNKQIGEYGSLKNITELKTLFINYNNIIDTSFLKNLLSLESLNLSDNNITDISCIQNLKKLNSLVISYNNISDSSCLKNLIKLNSLVINSNNIADISFLQNFVELTNLNASHNKIYDISFLQNLTSLVSLNISNNKVNKGSTIQYLVKLTSLYIQSNNFTDISFLKDLNNLEILDISNNKIVNIFSLQNLLRLNTLNISNNYLSSLFYIQDLVNLTSLDIHSNGVNDISFLQNLKKLKSLNISRNKISTAYGLKHLVELKSLNIGINNISDASFMKNLTNLVFIDINNNKFEDFSQFLPLVKKGNRINLKDSNLKNGISLFENPWILPPIEVLKNGNEAILDYFSDLSTQGKAYLFEAKMIVIGKGGSGKTSLIKKLLDRNAILPKEEETTKGIDIDRIFFTNDDNKEFIINIWDFGGQEIYHATHQFFLTKRSLYILVDDTRDDDKSVNDASFKYWLQTVELFGDGSPLLIFQNEKGGRSKDLDIKSMQAKFDFIYEKHSDDLNNPQSGLNNLETAIKYNIQKLPQIGQILPRQWVKIRSNLLQLASKKPYITIENYFEICELNNIAEKKAMLNLSQYLHDLGTFLHFQNDDLLRKTIILDNEWATDAVYNVLDNEAIKKEHGMFSKKDASLIWNESTYVDMHPELLSLMLKFELCYSLNKIKGTYLIPQLLPESRPDSFHWDTEYNLHLKYKYEFMPKGLLSRFIVRVNPYLKDLSKCWKKGVILVKDDTLAFIEEKYGINEISIRIRGVNKKELLIIMAEELERLNSEYDGIKVEKLIPCICSTCKKLQSPHFYKYKEIVKRFNFKKNTIGCAKEPFEEISVPVLLYDFFNDFMDDISGRRKVSFDNDVRLKYQAKTINFCSDTNINTSNIMTDGGKIISIGNENKDISVSAEDQLHEHKTSTSVNDNLKDINTPLLSQWWMQRVLGAFSAGLFAMIATWWFEWCHPVSAFLIVFPLLAALLLYFGNPARRFFRAAVTAFSAAMSVFILQLGFKFDWTQNVENGNFKLALEWLTEYDWLIGLCFLALSAWLFWMDWKKDKNDSSN